MNYQTLNPFTGVLEKSFRLATGGEVEAALDRSVRTFRSMRSLRPAARAERLEKLAVLLEQRSWEFAALMAVEMGKPVTEGEAEISKCAKACRHFAKLGEEYLRADFHPSDASESFVSYEPLGPILAIMPWNFPFWQVIRFAAPTLMAGNTVILKHAPGTPQCALAIAQLFLDAGFPEGAFQNLFLTNEQAALVIADKRVRGVTLTGSTAAGRAVAAVAGQWLKKTVLELGGSDPFIVLPDVDVDETARLAVSSRCINSGQSCIAAKRFLVHQSIMEVFADKFQLHLSRRVIGDPSKRETEVGPMARADLRDRLHTQVQQCIASGARLIAGGCIPDGPGFFYPPTMLTSIPRQSPAWSDELFGPVGSLIPFEAEDDLIAIANDTPFGLGASIWTKDLEMARSLAARIEAGGVFINGIVKSDPRLPFGGTKDSGLGRELSREGMLEFTNHKTTWIQ